MTEQDYIVYHEIFEDGEWQVTHDTITATGWTVEEGIVAFEGETDTLLVTVEKFVTARTSGVQ